MLLVVYRVLLSVLVTILYFFVVFMCCRNTGKTTLALDVILHQQLHNGQLNCQVAGLNDTPITLPIMHCVYVAVGQSKTQIERTVAMLEQSGAMKYTTVVAALDTDPTTLQVFLSGFVLILCFPDFT